MDVETFTKAIKIGSNTPLRQMQEWPTMVAMAEHYARCPACARSFDEQQFPEETITEFAKRVTDTHINKWVCELSATSKLIVVDVKLSIRRVRDNLIRNHLITIGANPADTTHDLIINTDGSVEVGDIHNRPHILCHVPFDHLLPTGSAIIEQYCSSAINNLRRTNTISSPNTRKWSDGERERAIPYIWAYILDRFDPGLRYVVPSVAANGANGLTVLLQIQWVDGYYGFDTHTWRREYGT